jgi:CheY-like chemotaxis protein
MEQEQLNVLVIDDDPAMVALLSDIVARREHQVITAASAEEGLELLPYWTFHVAFLDQKLPRMEGLVFGEYLRKNNPDMTIALVTGLDDKRLQRKSKDLSIVYVTKPFVVEDILGLVDGYLEGARSRRDQRLATRDEHHAPPLREHASDLTAAFGVPSVPERVGDRVVETIKRSLNNLRAVSRYTERDRVLAFSGLVTARVLGLDLPRASSDRTLFEEYDELMRQHGRRTEFDEAPAAESGGEEPAG